MKSSEVRQPHSRQTEVAVEQIADDEPTAAPLAPHRAALLLTLAALSYVVCGGFGLAAWWLARRDLREMAGGRMDPAGLNQTRAAHVLGATNMALHLVGGIVIVAVVAAILAREFYR